GCLACKACASQCPIKVDVPSFRARFLNIYHSRYQRPMKDYMVANIETMLPIMAKAPKIINGVLKQSFTQSLTKKTLGYVDMPLLSVPTLKERCKSKEISTFNLENLTELSENERKKHVMIVQDPFTSYYDAEVVSDFIELIQRLGLKPVLLPFKPNGKAQHIKGFLKQFTTTAKTSSEFLNRLAELDIPMVGVDPALVLCYRDEYNEILADKRGDFTVLTVHEWLYPQLSSFVKATIFDKRAWQLFAHCTEKTKLPNAEKEWGEIFRHFGLILNTVPVGCCG
ncbi:(Fe-S)-binding protein, partial [Aliivibrio sifiae]